MNFILKPLPPSQEIETETVLRKASVANRYLGELKGISTTIPNQLILINNLFFHPYTKIEFIMRDLNVSRITATKYLDALTEDGLLKKGKISRSNYYVNIALYNILTK